MHNLYDMVWSRLVHNLYEMVLSRLVHNLYEMVLSRLVHNLFTVQVCTRTPAVLTVVCFALSLQTNAKIVFQLGHHHFLENCETVGSHSSFAEHWSLLESCCVAGQVGPCVWKAPWSFEMGGAAVPVAQHDVTTDHWPSATLQQELQTLQNAGHYNVPLLNKNGRGLQLQECHLL